MNDKPIKIGLLFGSFNPITVGHLALAKLAKKQMNLDEFWMVVSPLNPYKAKSGELADEKDRLEMAHLAVKDFGDVSTKVSDIEYELPRPSYTFNTLKEIKKLHPNSELHFICGVDVFNKIEKWKNFYDILDLTSFVVQDRHGFENEVKDEQMLKKTVYLQKEEDMHSISATMIRERLKNNESISELVTPSVEGYINQKQLYK